MEGILQFCTKKDVNGNRKYLIVDVIAKQYSRNFTGWFYSEDFVTISTRDRNKMIKKLTEEGYIQK